MFTYGTAVLSHLPISKTIEHTFKPASPTLNKRFLLRRIAWKPDLNIDKEKYIDIVSVHLDFSRGSVRQQQIAEMTNALATRRYPIMILGDFNSD